MNTVAYLFQKFTPLFFSYLCDMKEKKDMELPPFLLHGPLYSGKEWIFTKTFQLLNCPSFLEIDHHPLFCKTCSHINTLSSSEGIFFFMSAIPIKDFHEPLLKTLSQINKHTDFLKKEALIHEIAKIELFIQASLQKESGSTKKITITKAQEWGEQLSNMRHDITHGSVKNSQQKELETILLESSVWNTDMGLDYLKTLLKKIHLSPSHTSSYRVLALKDPVLMKNQELLLNTLLKTIEDEKRHFTTFVITQKQGQILSTVKSRMNRLSFKPFSYEYKEVLKKELPQYIPILSLGEKTPKPTLETIENSPPHYQKTLILDYLEDKKSSYAGISPLLSQKRKQIQNLILGIKEYNLPTKNVLEILPYL